MGWKVGFDGLGLCLVPQLSWREKRELRTMVFSRRSWFLFLDLQFDGNFFRVGTDHQSEPEDAFCLFSVLAFVEPSHIHMKASWIHGLLVCRILHMLNFQLFLTFGVFQSMNFCRSEIYPWFSDSVFSPGTCSEKKI